MHFTVICINVSTCTLWQLELKLGIGGTSYEDFIRSMHLPLQLRYLLNMLFPDYEFKVQATIICVSEIRICLLGVLTYFCWILNSVRLIPLWHLSRVEQWVLFQHWCWLKLTMLSNKRRKGANTAMELVCFNLSQIQVCQQIFMLNSCIWI